MKAFTILAITAVMSVSASTQDTSEVENQSTPAPCSDALYRQFDFWVGDWDVFTTGGDKVGTNSISIEESGCLLVEHWTDANGGTGQSYNFIDLAAGKWRQVWVSPGATIDYVGGINDEGAMELEGTLGTASDEPKRFRGTWAMQEDGSVMQHLRHFDSESNDWAAGFVGIYKKRTP